ncbi:DEAD box ATP-dependent RNA helicase [Alteracholeplasma palmae J233]|uniref:DEAD box ATP-dependent RNA helicase n=1 Tax=Alteracholeplasma palmae (strain ATCC 49389 / J233) TaxID=1318466 RepID=U4KKL9_ALTPJ|nr:DEAD/DEAH box helicase [Alteracholeplasma palmae]CCV64187.1 DEAD box ATP-dependent RNA helicase [Alteracholeplasma palmae J233]
MNVLFNDLPILEQTKKALEELNFEYATPIQGLAIPKMIEGKDLIGQAQTGTGKTFAFGIPIVERINPKLKTTQSLILCPTRELTLQVYKEIIKLVRFYPEIKVTSIYGGESYERQFKALALNPHIIVATPGRIIDHMERGKVDFSGLEILTLDEADEMLKMGFQDDIEKILKGTPDTRQTVLFSATMPPFIRKIATKYQKDPEIIKVENKTLTVDSIKQYYLVVKETEKPKLLTRILDLEKPHSGIIFANTKKNVDTITLHLQQAGYLADSLHGDLKQSQRQYVMGRFRSKQLSILVATDVAARGLDVSDVEMVINYDLPYEDEVYVHRIGRTGRAGKKGVSYTFVGPRKTRQLAQLEKFIKIQMELMKVPTTKEINQREMERFNLTIKDMIEKSKEVSFDHQIVDELLTKYTEREIIDGLITSLLPEEKSYQEIEMPKNVGRNERESRFGNNSNAQRGGRGMSEMVINLGKQDQINPSVLLELLRKRFNVYSKNVGNIKHFQTETVFELNEQAVSKMNLKQSVKVNGKNVQINKKK